MSLIIVLVVDEPKAIDEVIAIPAVNYLQAIIQKVDSVRVECQDFVLSVRPLNGLQESLFIHNCCSKLRPDAEYFPLDPVWRRRQ